MYSAVFSICTVDQVWSLSSSPYLMIFLLLFLLVKRSMLKFPTITMKFHISSFSFVNFFFISFKAILLHICTLLLFSYGYPRNYNMHPWLIKIWYYLVFIPSSQEMQEFRGLKTISIYLIYSSWLYCHSSGIF